MKVSLTASSINELEKLLRKSAKALRDAPNEIVETLLDFGELEVSDNVLYGDAADGNTDVGILNEQNDNKGKLSIVGDSVAYQEFGYGLVGHVNKNPKQPPEYEQGQKTSWVYKDDSGSWRVSHGMEAQMPMYKASKAIREILPHVVKDIVENAIGALR